MSWSGSRITYSLKVKHGNNEVGHSNWELCIHPDSMWREHGWREIVDRIESHTC